MSEIWWYPVIGITLYSWLYTIHTVGRSASSQYVSRSQTRVGTLQWICTHYKELHQNVHRHQSRMVNLFSKLQHGGNRVIGCLACKPSSTKIKWIAISYTVDSKYHFGIFSQVLLHIFSGCWRLLPNTMICPTSHSVRQRDNWRDYRQNWTCKARESTDTGSFLSLKFPLCTVIMIIVTS